MPLDREHAAARGSGGAVRVRAAEAGPPAPTGRQEQDEKENPKLPPPIFSYFHDEHYLCGFDMYMNTWSTEITGSSPELVRDDVLAAGIPDETQRDTAHTKSLTIVENRFRLTLPKEQVLHGTLPTALVRGQAPG